jgi:hypothetical protein
MGDAIEILTALRDKKVQLLKSWEEQAELIKSNILGVRSQISGIEESIKELTEQSTRAPDQETLALPHVGKYAETPLTEAVADIINKVGQPPGLKVPQIIDILRREGFEREADNFYASVYSVAMRLLKQGRIKESQTDGLRSFMAAHPF